MKELLNLERDFQRGRWLVFLVIGCCFAVAITAVVLSYRYSREFSKRIYLVNRGDAIEATCGDVTDNRTAEARYHVARFHELFFSVSPDPKSIESNCRKAFFLCDESARKLYNNLNEQNYYREMIEGNVTQGVSIDSVTVDMRGYPYHAFTFARITQTRSSAETERRLVTESELYDINRSDNSPNGYLMRNFHILSSTITRSSSR